MPLSGKNSGDRVDQTFPVEGMQVSDPNHTPVDQQENDSSNFGVFRVRFESTRAPTITESVRSRSTTASSRAARAALDLQHLEEERRMEKEFLAKKYQILQAQLDEENGSVRSHQSRTSTQRTQDWVKSQVVPTTSIATESRQILVGTQSRTGTIPKVISAVPASQSATFIQPPMQDQGAHRRNNKVANVQDPIVSSVSQPSNVGQPMVVSSVTTHDEAVGGFSPISPDQNVIGVPGSFVISPPALLTKELYDLHKRVEELQLQLVHESHRHSQQQIQPNQMLGQMVTCIPTSETFGVPGQTKLIPMPQRNPLLELPPVRNSVSQSCSTSVTHSATPLRTSISLFDSLPSTRPSEMMNKTLPYITEPYLIPPLMPFATAHTPQAHSTPPSVHTVSSHVSPVMSSMVPTSAPITTVNDMLPRQLFSGPNSQQLAARQVVPRKLPAFSGDPVEWPLFLSCYQNSTVMCGYSPGENLMRLQRCLRGNALETVRSFLMHPSSVPVIIDTLRTLYGRPGLIINSLLSKIRATPTPKASLDR